MISFLKDLKDPWKLLVVALVAANVTAAVAVVMMLGNKKAAETARAEMRRMMETPTASDQGKTGAITREIRRLAELRTLTQTAALESTSESDVSRYIHRWADHANLSTERKITYQAKTRRRGVKDHTWTLTFQGRDTVVTREELAFFLFQIKTRTPQLKIQEIKSGASGTKAEKADRWRPEVRFVLTKEEAPQ